MARAALGWSYDDFSERTGVARSSLVRFEAGQGIHLSTAIRIEQTLKEAGVTLIQEDAEHGPGVILAKEIDGSPETSTPARAKPRKRAAQARP